MLPLDLLKEILMKLPVKTPLRFKLLSRVFASHSLLCLSAVSDHYLLLTAEFYYLVNSRGKLNQVGMRGRHLDAYSTYKRVSSRDYYLGADNDKDDKDDTSIRMPNGLGKDIGNPSWKRSLPHVLVATISSFLFGYHLGVVNETLESMSLELGFSGNTMAEGLVGISAMCFTNDNWGFNECYNEKSLGYASGEVFCWNWNGYWPTCCSSICSRGFTSLCKGCLWELHSNCNVFWNFGIAIYWTSGQGRCGLVAHLFLGIRCSCCTTGISHGVLCRKSSLAFQER
ncbi:hypothetical protein LWI28_027199 [Acer negundo]|uniref:F-box domain-containing protein n=1 Tax=Acer negundo TaxID=4023 RepID=A0AAD5IHE9_ACENE|nr:hypothetical protein LWI28_027199 [Acer negundo]